MSGDAGGVVWLTGLSGAGKTTVAGLLDGLLRAEGRTPVLLDGDRQRAIMPAKFGYAQEDRRALAWWYARLAAEFAGQGHLVICATISLFHEVHDWSRANVANYLEVWLRAPVPELRTRPGRARLYDDCADVVGIGVEPEFPRRPDLVIDNYPPVTAARSATLIRSAVSHWYERDIA
ncbi:MAG TPA: adenylyl-sulfate kinase [Actinophytocola sp.]|nr:adenylyl-sulfate kinase [Actinophytocola sp.]